MRQTRFFLSGLLAAVLGGSACSSEPIGPQTSEAQPAPSLSLTGTLSAILLQCSPQNAISTTKTFGSEGGELWVGPHYLVIPKNALSKKVTITGEIVTGNVNSIRFYPEGLKFGSGTKLYMSYKNCSGLGMLLPKKVVYTDESLNLLDVLGTITLWGDKMAVADLHHFSRYAVAY